MAEEKEKKKKHSFSHTHIEHHKDGSATVHHVHKDGPDHDVKHAAASLDHIHDSMQDHLGGGPTEGDKELDNGQHGIPEAIAAPAGIPAGAAPAAGE
jgi:hypothetical protein